MNDVENEGVFVNSDGVEPTYTKWSTNEPSNSAKGNHYNGKDSPYDGEDFVIMNKGAVWNDIGNMNVHVICQLLCNSGNQIVNAFSKRKPTVHLSNNVKIC